MDHGPNVYFHQYGRAGGDGSISVVCCSHRLVAIIFGTLFIIVMTYRNIAISVTSIGEGGLIPSASHFPFSTNNISSLSSTFNNMRSIPSQVKLVGIEMEEDSTAKFPPTTDHPHTQSQHLRVFTCGYQFGKLRDHLFPYHIHVGTYYGPEHNVTYKSDILYFGMHGPCLVSYQNISTYFQGHVLVINGEPFNVNKKLIPTFKDAFNKSKFVQIGMRPTTSKPIFPGLVDASSTNNVVDIFFGPMALIGYMSSDKWQWILDPSLRPINNYVLNRDESKNIIPKSKVIYMSTSCKKHRQDAAKLINKIIKVDALGKCQIRKTRPGDTILNSTLTTTNDSQTSVKVKRSNHFHNWQLYRDYKYCLVLENSNPMTYVSEKIFWAFLGGCVPIYWGNRYDVFKMINDKSFVWWNTKNTTKGLTQLKYLESNYSAYLDMLHQPILRSHDGGGDGIEATIAKYFSLSADIGEGYLQNLIHKSLGIT